MSWVNQYMSIPFREMGRDRRGVDCWGMVRIVLREQAGIEVPSHEVNSFDGRAVLKAIAAEHVTWQRIPLGEEQSFDVVVMRAHYAHEAKWYGAETHVGIVVTRGLVLHIEPKVGASCIAMDHPSVRERIRKIYRHHEPDHHQI